jgi:hypothetical protein
MFMAGWGGILADGGKANDKGEGQLKLEEQADVMSAGCLLEV